MSTRAAQILLALNNQIQHTPQEKPSPFNKVNQESNAITNKKQPKGKLSSELTAEILVETQNINQKPNFSQQIKYEETKQSPQWLVEMLSKQIGGQVSQKLSQLVEGILRQRQKSTYDSLMGNHNHYLQAILENRRRNDQTDINAITNLMSARMSKVQGDLQRGKLEVSLLRDPKIVSKRQVQLLEKFNLQRMIKIKDGQLRSKVDILNEKMAHFQAVQSWQGPGSKQKEIQQGVRKRLAQSLDAANYSLDSEKTKIARDYVKYMNQQRRLLQKRKKQRQSRYAQVEAERENQINEAMQMKDLAKRQELLQKIEQRRLKKQEAQKQVEQKEQQAKSFLAEFHQKNPLYKQKEKQFQQKFIKPEQKLREEKLNEIRQHRKAMSMNQIKTHQQKYLVKLQADKAKRQEEFKLILSSRKVEDKRHYYRGSAHRKISNMRQQQQLRSYSLRQASKLKVLRMKEYGDVVHTKHQPKIDEDKKRQIMSLIQLDILKKKKTRKVYKQLVDQQTKEVKLVIEYEPLPQKDYKSEGNRYFDQAKKLMKKKPKETQTQNLEQFQQNEQKAKSLALLLSSKPEMESKHKSIWHVRAKQLQQFANSDIPDAANFAFVKHNIENLDKKAAQKEQAMKQIQVPMNQSFQEKANLDKFYLQSIKQKIKLLQ